MQDKPNGTQDIGSIKFLATKTSTEDLRTALRVLREFKACESEEEWLAIMFATWAKLEQCEEFLAYLVNGEKLKDDSIGRARIVGFEIPGPR